MSSIIEEIQQYLVHYRAGLKGAPVPLDRLTVEDVSLLKGCQVRSSKTQELDYKRGWTKLAKAQKLNRLMDYHARLTTDYELSSEQQTQLKTLFYGSDFDQRVCYNVNEGIVSSIQGLKRDKDGIFYLEKESETGGSKVLILDITKRKTITSMPREAPLIRKFEPIESSKLSNDRIKVKPIIKRKN